MKIRNNEKNLLVTMAQIYINEGKAIDIDKACVMINEVFDKAKEGDKKATAELGRIIKIYEEG